jgi:Mn-dependent DtxR family transcriptional regulator
MPSAAAGKRPCARSDTQEFLAEMLGVRRTSVSVVAHTLQQAGMIKYRRGTIEILDVDGLEERLRVLRNRLFHYCALLGLLTNKA